MGTAFLKQQSQSSHGRSPKRLLGRPLPREGENGLFSQSWFPLCLSSDVAPNQVRGEDFLDGRVVIFRTVKWSCPGAQCVLSTPRS